MITNILQQDLISRVDKLRNIFSLLAFAFVTCACIRLPRRRGPHWRALALLAVLLFMLLPHLNFALPLAMEPIDVEDGLRSLWWDLAGDARPVMLEGLMHIAGSVHLLYGSDTPYTPVPTVARNKESLATDLLIEPIVHAVFRDNAARSYGLDA